MNEVGCICLQKLSDRDHDQLHHSSCMCSLESSYSRVESECLNLVKAYIGQLYSTCISSLATSADLETEVYSSHCYKPACGLSKSSRELVLYRQCLNSYPGLSPNGSVPPKDFLGCSFPQNCRGYEAKTATNACSDRSSHRDLSNEQLLETYTQDTLNFYFLIIFLIPLRKYCIALMILDTLLKFSGDTSVGGTQAEISMSQKCCSLQTMPVVSKFRVVCLS